MSIFDEKNKVCGTFFRFQKIGDQIEGILVDKKEINNFLRPETKQWLYELRTLNGVIVAVPGKKAIDVIMSRVQIGQNVGFRYTKDLPHKKFPLNPAKIIEVYVD